PSSSSGGLLPPLSTATVAPTQQATPRPTPTPTGRATARPTPTSTP
ncbi:MAG: hypothetical protein JWM18_3069, partial [Chloroflexi bacterium]|nr:hypothetical protein [Chloroflexota bacterium]